MKKITLALIAALALSACGDSQDSSELQQIRNPRVVDLVKLNPRIPELIKNLCLESTNGAVTQAERRILDLTNAERQRNGLRPLILDACASKVARQHSQTMASRNYMNHFIDGKGPMERMRDASVGFSMVYENIHNWNEYANNQAVWNYGAYPDRAMGFWTTSPTHRANLLNPQVTHIGIGVAPAQHGNQGMLAGTQLFFKP